MLRVVLLMGRRRRYWTTIASSRCDELPDDRHRALAEPCEPSSPVDEPE
jgi:hypothetical protein